MMEEWIEYNLKSIVLDRKKRYDILANYKKTLTGVTKKGKKVEIFELSDDLKTIKKIEL